MTSRRPDDPNPDPTPNPDPDPNPDPNPNPSPSPSPSPNWNPNPSPDQAAKLGINGTQDFLRLFKGFDVNNDGSHDGPHPHPHPHPDPIPNPIPNRNPTPTPTPFSSPTPTSHRRPLLRGVQAPCRSHARLGWLAPYSLPIGCLPLPARRSVEAMVEARFQRTNYPRADLAACGWRPLATP